MEKKRSRGGSAAIIAGVSHKVRVGLGYSIFAVIEYKIFFSCNNYRSHTQVFYILFHSKITKCD